MNEKPIDGTTVIRNTTQREAILEAFHLAGRPLTAIEIHELAKRISPRLGLRTVYRHVKDLLAKNQIISIDYPGQPLRYEFVDNRGSRPHFICRKCGKLYDLPVREPKIVFPDVPGFDIKGFEVIFFGYCKDCRK